MAKQQSWQPLAAENLEEIRKAGDRPKGEVYYPSRVWCRTLFDLAVSYRDGVVPKQEMIDALVPLYYSRMLSFYNKMEHADTKACEAYIENINRVFEAERGYFLHRWDR